MRTQRRTSIIVVGGTLAVASVAYGLGTQAGDGTAVAGGEDGRDARGDTLMERCAPPDFDGLSERLGVDEAELREALDDFHAQRRGEHRAELATALAEALDKPADEVEDALERIESRLKERFQRFRSRGDLPPPPPIRMAMPLRGLASELDVSRAELREALREIRLEPNEFERHDEELASFLADRFDLDVDRVSDALAEMRPPLSSPHRRGLPDHPPAL
jgi:hypothetical protein